MLNKCTLNLYLYESKGTYKNNKDAHCISVLMMFWCSRKFCFAAFSDMLLIFWFWCSRNVCFAVIFVCLSPRVCMVVLRFMYWWVSSLLLVCMATLWQAILGLSLYALSFMYEWPRFFSSLSLIISINITKCLKCYLIYCNRK